MKGFWSRVGAQRMLVALPHHTWAVVCAHRRLQVQRVWISHLTSSPVSPRLMGTTVLISAPSPNTWIYLKKYFSLKQFSFPSNLVLSNNTCETTGLIHITNYTNKKIWVVLKILSDVRAIRRKTQRKLDLFMVTSYLFQVFSVTSQE